MDFTELAKGVAETYRQTKEQAQRLVEYEVNAKRREFEVNDPAFKDILDFYKEIESQKYADIYAINDWRTNAENNIKKGLDPYHYQGWHESVLDQAGEFGYHERFQKARETAEERIKHDFGEGFLKSPFVEKHSRTIMNMYLMEEISNIHKELIGKAEKSNEAFEKFLNFSGQEEKFRNYLKIGSGTRHDLAVAAETCRLIGLKAVEFKNQTVAEIKNSTQSGIAAIASKIDSFVAKTFNAYNKAIDPVRKSFSKMRSFLKDIYQANKEVISKHRSAKTVAVEPASAASQPAASSFESDLDDSQYLSGPGR